MNILDLISDRVFKIIEDIKQFVFRAKEKIGNQIEGIVLVAAKTCSSGYLTGKDTVGENTRDDFVIIYPHWSILVGGYLDYKYKACYKKEKYNKGKNWVIYKAAIEYTRTDEFKNPKDIGKKGTEEEYSETANTLNLSKKPFVPLENTLKHFTGFSLDYELKIFVGKHFEILVASWLEFTDVIKVEEK